MSSKQTRLAQLEAAQQKWAAEHVPRSELLGYLTAVLNIVEEEAGPDVAARVGGRVVSSKAQRVAHLSEQRP